jgi:hypothetical protein
MSADAIGQKNSFDAAIDSLSRAKALHFEIGPLGATGTLYGLSKQFTDGET